MPFQAKFDIGSTSDAESVAGNGSIIALLKRLRTLLGTLLTEGLAVSGSVDVTSVTLPTAIYSGVKAVAAAGTDEVLASSQALKSGVIIKAHSTNTGTIYVGPEGVTAATGFRLSAGESVFVEVDNLADVWLDCSVSGEGVSFIAGVDVLSGFDFQFASNSAYAALL